MDQRNADGLDTIVTTSTNEADRSTAPGLFYTTRNWQGTYDPMPTYIFTTLGGDDSIAGGRADDTIYGGGGNEILSGGEAKHYGDGGRRRALHLRLRSNGSGGCNLRLRIGRPVADPA